MNISKFFIDRPIFAGVISILFVLCRAALAVPHNRQGGTGIKQHGC